MNQGTTKVLIATIVLLVLGSVLLCRGEGAKLEFEKPVDHYAYAQGLMRGKIYDYAKDAFDRFMAAYPGHELEASASANAIECLKHLEQYDEMLKRIAAFKERWPKNPNVDVFNFWSGEYCFQMKKYNEAAACFESLQSSKNAEIKEYSAYLLGVCLMQQRGNMDRVYELFKQVSAGELSKERRYRELALYDLAVHQQRTGHFAEARAGFKRLVAYGQTTATVRENALYNIGETYYAEGDFPNAQLAYDVFLAEYPKGELANEGMRRRAEALYDQKLYAEALKQVLAWRLGNANKDDYEMECLHGRCLYQLKEYSTAGPMFEAVLKMPDAPKEVKRICIVLAIHCLLEENGHDAWERGLTYTSVYFKDYKDATYESKVWELRGNLQEKLEKYDDAMVSYGKALDGTSDASLRERFTLRRCACLQKLERWGEAAKVLRELSESLAKQSSKKAGRASELRLMAGQFALKGDVSGKTAEGDFLQVAVDEKASAEQRQKCHEYLLGIYRQRKDYGAAHAQVVELLKGTMSMDKRQAFLFADALFLSEIGKLDDAVVRINDALAVRQKDETPEKLQVEMHNALLGLYQKKMQRKEDGAQEAMIREYTALLDFPEELTDKILTQEVLYSIGEKIRAQERETPTVAGRKMLERTYRRVIKRSIPGAPTALEVYCGYYLALMCMAPEVHDYELALSSLSFCEEAIRAGMKFPKEREVFLKELNQPRSLLMDCRARLAVCYYELGKDRAALEMANVVLSENPRSPAGKRCVLIQAKIYAYRSPKQLKAALEKINDYRYSYGRIQTEQVDDEEALVLAVKVLMELNRLEAAQDAYKQLKILYPERAKREPTLQKLAQ